MMKRKSTIMMFFFNIIVGMGHLIRLHEIGYCSAANVIESFDG